MLVTPAALPPPAETTTPRTIAVKPLRVGYSATVWDDRRSGIGIYIAEQIEALYRRHDIDVRVIEHGGRILPSGTLPVSSGTGAGIGRRVRPLRDIYWHHHGLHQVAAKEKLELVHIPTIRRLPGKMSCPVVVTVHDLGPLRLAQKYGTLRSIYHRRIVPRWLREVDAIVTPSRATRDDLVSLYGVDAERVTVVPNGANHELYSPGDRDESAALLAQRYGISGPFFVYVSRLEHPAKNHVRLLAAFERLKTQHGLPHTLVLVGSPWNGHETIMAAGRRGVEKGYVKFTGYAPKEHVPHFLRAAEAAIYPSLFEGFGLPVIEAMACGTPVACSRSSSLTEIAEGHGMLFNPLEIEDIASTMDRLATDPALRERLRTAGLRHARQFTWERSVEETAAVWRKTMEAAT